jgi:hypothetical protein
LRERGAVSSKRPELVLLSPKEAAERVVEAADKTWARAFVEELDRRLRTDPVGRLAARWRLSNAVIGRMFNVSRQAVSKWAADGAPSSRAPQLGDLDAATDILELHLPRDRIPAVVRRPSDALGGASLLDIALEGRTEDVLSAVRSMFDVPGVHP